MASVIGANIKRSREARGWSQARLAREVCRVTGISGAPIGRREISRYERGKRTPREWLPSIAAALDVTVTDLKTPRTAPADLPVSALSTRRKDDYAHTIRTLSQRLIALDNEGHGLPIAELAARSATMVHRRLGEGDYKPQYERDIQSAAAELAEIAGWALFNEGKFSAARRFSQEALFLARLSGDRSTELLTLQNLGMLAGWTGRAREELAIARSVLERGNLSPRVEAMFRAREAQGLAGTGNTAEATRSFARARSLIQDDGEAPYWAWWVTEREIDRQQGRILHETGDWRAALPVLESAMGDDVSHVGYANVASVRLLDCLLAVGAWHDARREAESLAPAVREMSSLVTLHILDRVATRAARSPKVPRDLRDALEHLASRMREDSCAL